MTAGQRASLVLYFDEREREFAGFSESRPPGAPPREVTGLAGTNMRAVCPGASASQPRVWRPPLTPTYHSSLRPTTAAAAAAAPSTSAWATPPFFTCCVCGEPLKPVGVAPATTTAPLVCPAGHAVDVAKEGHVFLLPNGRKKRESAGPAGDAHAQVAARRAFFDAGWYDPILRAGADAVCEVLLSRGTEGTAASSPAVVLDAGCGEGAYLAALAAHPSLPPTTALLGIDVSKPAIRLGSARYGSDHIRFAVASSFAIPLEAGAVSCVLCAMAPVPPEVELRRVLGGGGGGLVVVRPGPQHLDGLRRAVYGERARFDKEGGEGGGGGAPGGASPTTTAQMVSRTRLTFPLALPGPAAVALLGMTPYAWSAARGLGERLSAEGLETLADVWVETFRIV